MSNTHGWKKRVEHATANPRTRTRTTGAFTPIIASGSEMKVKRRSRCRGEVGAQRAQKVRDSRVVYAVVPDNVDGDDALVRF